MCLPRLQGLMMDCIQGQLNKKDIENIKILSHCQSEDIKEIRNSLHKIELAIADMTGKLNASLKENADGKEKLDAHLECSESRVEDIKLNSIFRKVGVWAIGIIYIALVGVGINRLTK